MTRIPASWRVQGHSQCGRDGAGRCAQALNPTPRYPLPWTPLSADWQPPPPRQNPTTAGSHAAHLSSCYDESSGLRAHVCFCVRGSRNSPCAVGIKSIPKIFLSTWAVTALARGGSFLGGFCKEIYFQAIQDTRMIKCSQCNTLKIWLIIQNVGQWRGRSCTYILTAKPRWHVTNQGTLVPHRGLYPRPYHV